MLYRPLSGLSVSEIGLGCNNFGRFLGQNETTAVVRAALEAGITFFDTADVYGRGDQPFSGFGKSEQYLGRALGSMRDQVVVATKFGGRTGDRDFGGRRGSRKFVTQSCEDSLRRLGTDYIDLFQMHVPDDETSIEETFEALTDLAVAGKILRVGVSNMSRDQLMAAAKASPSELEHGLASTQGEYSLLVRDVETSLLATCRELGIGFIPYFPLASGLLTGKYLNSEEPGDARLRKWVPRSHFERSERVQSYILHLNAFARERGQTLLQLAFSWLLARDPVVSVIAGATKPSQVVANAACSGWRLTQDDLDAIDATWRSRFPFS